MATLNEVMKDIADAIREKKGTTELIAPVDFAEEIKGITAGGGEGSVEEKVGMIYTTKDALLSAFDVALPETVSQDMLKILMAQLSIMPIVACKGKPTNAYAVTSYADIVSINIDENRFTYDAWSYAALDFDRLVYYNNKEMPAWGIFSDSLEIAISTMNEIFPTRITKEQFYALE
jgi:hypothetical protein